MTEALAFEPQDSHEIAELPDASVHLGPVDEGTHDAKKSIAEQSLVVKEAHIEDADIV